MAAINFVIAFYTVQFITRSTSKCDMTHTGHIGSDGHTHTLCTPKPRAIKPLLEPVLSDSSYQRAVKWKLH